MAKERISKVGGLRWPCPDEKHPGTGILHTERFSTPDGKARMSTVQNTQPGEATSPEYPILLTTGRIVVHYNSGSMTMRSASLQERDPEIYVEMNPLDALQLKVNAGDMVVIITRRGEAEAEG